MERSILQRMIERRRVLLGGLFLLAAPSAVLAKDGDGSSVEKFLRRKRDRKPESSSEPVDESPIFETPDFDDPFAQDEQYYDPTCCRRRRAKLISRYRRSLQPF